MAIVRFSTIKGAVNALVSLHGTPEAAAGLAGDNLGLVISFAKSGVQG